MIADRSPNLDELDALMERVQAKAPAVGDNAQATLVLALALIDVKLAALDVAVGVGEGPDSARLSYDVAPPLRHLNSAGS